MSTEIQKSEDKSPALESRQVITPRYTVEKKDHSYEVRVQLPGVRRDDASITLDRDNLVVEAKRSPHWDGQWRIIHREIVDADYRLELQLNLHVKEDDIRANSRDGVLIIHLPVAEEARPRSIKIN